jgi:hypothetical protein
MLWSCLQWIPLNSVSHALSTSVPPIYSPVPSYGNADGSPIADGVSDTNARYDKEPDTADHMHRFVQRQRSDAALRCDRGHADGIPAAATATSAALRAPAVVHRDERRPGVKIAAHAAQNQAASQPSAPLSCHTPHGTALASCDSAALFAAVLGP